MKHIAVAVVAAFGLVALVSCSGATDPTEDAFAVTIHNDTSSAVVLLQCDVRCNQFHSRVTLPPGGREPTNVSSSGVVNRWEVQDQRGRTLGCLPISFKGKQNGVVVNVSGMSPPPC